MNEATSYFNDVGHLIQLALAPAFLLTGIAGLLNVMTGRLSRIIDRGRELVQLPSEIDPAAQEARNTEQQNLQLRGHFASVAITACTLSALLACLVIAVLFIKTMFSAEVTWVIGCLFTASTLTLVVGLGYFLREVLLATQSLRFLFPKKVHPKCDKG